MYVCRSVFWQIRLNILSLETNYQREKTVHTVILYLTSLEKFLFIKTKESKVTVPLPSESSQSREKRVQKRYCQTVCTDLGGELSPKRKTNESCGFSPVRKLEGWKEGDANGDFNVQMGEYPTPGDIRWCCIETTYDWRRRLKQVCMWLCPRMSVGCFGWGWGNICAIWGLGFCIAASAWLDKNLFYALKPGVGRPFLWRTR